MSNSIGKFLSSAIDTPITGRTGIEDVDHFVYIQPVVPMPQSGDDMSFYYAASDVKCCCIEDIYENFQNGSLAFNPYTLDWGGPSGDGLDIDLTALLAYGTGKTVAIAWYLNDSINTYGSNTSVGFNQSKIPGTTSPLAVTSADTTPGFNFLSGDAFTTGIEQVGTKLNGSPIYALKFMVVTCTMVDPSLSSFPGVNFNVQFINSKNGIAVNMKIDPKVKNNGTPGGSVPPAAPIA